MPSDSSNTSNGEIGDSVLYVCAGTHNSPSHMCEVGDVHPALVADVQTRDADGKPSTVLLALLIPQQPSIQWVTAPRGARQPGRGSQVTRVHRGAPPAEAMTPAQGSVAPIGTFQLDFLVGSWHTRGE